MTDRSVIAYPAILHFSESHHYIREVSPANTVADDNCALSSTMTTHVMWTMSHCAQAHDLLILAMTVKNVDNEVFVRKRTIRELSAQAHKLSISHRA